MGKLTPLGVKNAKPGRHSDGQGLYLLAKPSGSKSWVLRVQVDGVRRDYGLGSFEILSLAEARDKAREGRKLAKSGISPSAEWKRARRVVPTFKVAATEYHQQVKKGWRNGKHQGQWLATLRAYAFPLIGERPVDQIEAPDIQNVLMPIWLTKAETAKRVRQRIATVLDYAHGQGWRDTEAPMRAVNSLLGGIKQPKGKNFAAMPYGKVPDFMASLKAADQTLGRQALQLLILTAVRSGEVRGATVGEIDRKERQWIIPAHRMKMGEAHAVPLSDAAMTLIEDRIEAVGDAPDALLFPGLKRAAPMSDMTLAKALKSSGGPGYTVHGFRSAFRDWVAEQTSFPGEWAEAALAHSQANKVEAAYRRTKFLDQRRQLMDAWQQFLT